MALLPLLSMLALAPTGEVPAEVQEVFDDACTMCHDASDDLNLEGASLASLREAKGETGVAMIAPGEADQSYLMMKLMGAEGIDGDPMPLDEDALPPEQLKLIADWIGSLEPEASDGPAAATVDAREATPQDAPQDAGEARSDPPDSGEEPPPAEIVTTRDDTWVRKVSRKPFLGTHQTNLQTTTTLGKKTLEFRIHHRFGRVGKPKDRTYAGLAGGAVMSWGMSYGIVDGLDAMIRWTNVHLDWELGVKYIPLRQENGAPLSLGAYASFEALTDFPENAENRFTGNYQLLISRLWLERWSTQLMVGYSMFTNHSTHVLVDFEDGNGSTLVRDRRGTISLGLASTVWVGRKKNNGIDIEYILPVPDAGDPDIFYRHGGDADPEGSKVGSWSLGWTGKAGLHLFQVFVTNTRNIHTNLVAPGGDTKNPFKPFGDFFFGFNLSRRWKI
jgi:hypothetical protein